MTLRIVEPGWSTTIQDHGRRGHAALGVPTAGAVDRAALDLANRLVGNPAGAAALETAHGLVVEAVGAVIAATSGDGLRHTLQPGERLTVAAPPEGMWGYFAVRGGIDVAPVLGSRSHDTLSGVGPPPLEAGTKLSIGTGPTAEMPADLAPPRPRPPVVRLWPGPHLTWFGGLDALTADAWTVQRDVSRVGMRLTGGSFVRSTGRFADDHADAHDELTSFGLVEGAIQVTPSDEPIIMLANHPTTGGYPVIAVVDADDIRIVAQARPGTTIRFRPG